LLIPLLNEHTKTLLAKLARDKLDDYAVVKDYLLREFKLTPQQYRDKYLSAQKLIDETYTLYGSRLHNYLQYYWDMHWDMHKVVSKDDVMELLLTDRIKETLPEPCLRHILASEGQDWFKPEKLTQVIDTYVASHGDTSRFGVSVASKPVKSFGGVSSPQVKSFSPNITSTSAQAQCSLLCCFSCGKIRHKSSQCRTVQSGSPRVVKQPIERSGGSNLTNIPPKAKINHAKTNVQEFTIVKPSLVHWLGAKPIIDVLEIRIPPNTFYTEQEMYFRENIKGYAAKCYENAEMNQLAEPPVSCVDDYTDEVGVSLTFDQHRVFCMFVKVEHQTRRVNLTM